MTIQVGNLVVEPPATEKPAVHFQSGRLRFACDTITCVATSIDAIGDIITLMRIPTNAQIYSLELMTAAQIDSNGTPLVTLDVGFYQDQVNVGLNDTLTAVDQNALGTALTNGRSDETVFTEVRFETQDETTCNDPVWDLAGVAADPGGNYILAVTILAAPATAAAGTVQFRCLYSVD